jgi:hypothetical protein
MDRLQTVSPQLGMCDRIPANPHDKHQFPERRTSGIPDALRRREAVVPAGTCAGDQQESAPAEKGLVVIYCRSLRVTPVDLWADLRHFDQGGCPRDRRHVP